MSSDSSKESQIANLEHDFSAVRERQGRLEQSVATLAETTKAMAEGQSRQQQAIGELSSDVQSILTLIKSRDGRFDYKMVITVVSLIIGIVGPLAVMFISPLRLQVDTLQVQSLKDITDLHHVLDAHLSSDGTPAVRIRFATQEQEIKLLHQSVDMLQTAAQRRLEEEATIGRAIIHEGKSKP